MWDEITYPFSNGSGTPVEVWEWISNFTPLLEMWLFIYVGIKHNLQENI